MVTFWAMDQRCEDAVGLAVAGDEGDARPVTSAPPSREDLQQHLRLAMAGKPGQADDFPAGGRSMPPSRPLADSTG